MGATGACKNPPFSQRYAVRRPVNKIGLACVGGWVLVELLEDARTGLPAATERVQDQCRARCRRCRRRIEKGAARVEIRAFVRPGRRTLLLRCADCVDARFAAAVLAVHGRAERVPVEAALVGSAEAQRVQRAIDAASGGGGSMRKRCVCVFWAKIAPAAVLTPPPFSCGSSCE